METFLQSLPTPPEEFYYALFVLFSGALIWIIKNYINRLDTTVKQLSDTVKDIHSILKLHDYKHEQTEKQLEELKAKL